MTPRDAPADLPPRLVLFPGLGVDGGLFAPQAGLPARVETPAWVDPQPDDTIESYAKRMADRVDPSPAGRPLYLGGVSFGGMVALEAARYLKPRGVFIMSSGFSGQTLAPAVRAMLAGASVTPPGVMRQMLKLTPLFIRIVGRPRRHEREAMVGLVPRVNVKLCVWGAGAILRWAWRGEFPAPVHHIHGDIDRIVPVENVRPDYVLPGAGHALNVTHAAEVNRYLAARMVAPPASDSLK